MSGRHSRRKIRAVKTQPIAIRPWIRFCCGLIACTGSLALVKAQGPLPQGPSLPLSRIEPEQTAPSTAQPEAPKAVRVNFPVRTASIAATAEPAATMPPASSPGPRPVIVPVNQPVANPSAGGDSPAILPQVSARPIGRSVPRVAGAVPLFDSSEVGGWRIHEGKAGAWKRTGSVVSSAGSGGGWLMTEADFSDFELSFDYRLGPGANSGVAIRATPEGNPSSSGIEVQLLDDTAPKYAGLNPNQYTGSLYYQVAPQVRPELRPVGEWNQCRIRCAGFLIEVAINGQVVNRVHLAPVPPSASGEQQKLIPVSYVDAPVSLQEKPPLGRIALQSHPAGVEFRGMELLPLNQRAPSGLSVTDLETGPPDAPEAKPEDRVRVHFVGQFSDGRTFTDSRSAGSPVSVALADVIRGWQEGIPGMRVGGRRRLMVPAELAYGANGVENLIPPAALLVFEVELHGIEQ